MQKSRLSCRRTYLKSMAALPVSIALFSNRLPKSDTTKHSKHTSIIAVGDGATNILNQLIENGCQCQSTSVFMESSCRPDSMADQVVCISSQDLKRTGVLRSRLRSSLYGEIRGESKTNSEKRSKNIVLACLGGRTGTIAGPVVASLSCSLGVRTSAFLVMPFLFEGAKRLKTAKGGLTNFQRLGLEIIIHHNYYSPSFVGRPFGDAAIDNDNEIYARLFSLT